MKKKTKMFAISFPKVQIEARNEREALKDANSFLRNGTITAHKAYYTNKL